MKRRDYGLMGISGIAGIVIFAAFFYGVSVLILHRPLGGEYGILFPYLTHPVGWVMGTLIFFRLHSHSGGVVPRKLKLKWVILGAIVSPVCLFVTGPLMMPLLNAIDLAVAP